MSKENESTKGLSPVLLSVTALAEHPLQNKVYKTETDFQFIESIRTRGVLQPLLVAENATVEDGNIILRDKGRGTSDLNGGFTLTQYPKPNTLHPSFVLVAGHRRLQAAKTAGLEFVPVILKTYNSVEIINLDYLESNRQREKNDAEKKAEFLAYKSIIQEFAKYKMIKGDKVNLNNEKRGGVVDQPQGTQNVKNSSVFDDAIEFLLRIGFDADGNFKTRDALIKATGITQSDAKMLLKVEDDNYFENKENYWLRNGISEKQVEIFKQEWVEIRGLYFNDSLTLKEAADKIDGIFRKAEKYIKKDEKPKVKEKPRCYLSLPVSKNPNALEDSMKYQSELSQEYRVLNPVAFIIKQEAELNRKLDWTECMELLMPELFKCNVYAVRGTEEMRRESVGCRIEDITAILLNKKRV